MSTIGYINVALELWGVLLSLITIVFLHLGGREPYALRRAFLRIVLSNILILFCDAMAWIFKGNTTPLGFAVVRVSNFLVFAGGYLLLGCFTDYLRQFLALRTPVNQFWPRAVWVLCAVAIALVALSQFNDMYYRIDEFNVYERQGMFWLSQVWGIICMFVNGGMLIAYRRHMSRRDLIFLGGYMLTPALAMLIQIFFYGVAVLNVATSLSILTIYIGVQAEQSGRLRVSEAKLADSRVEIMMSQIQPHFMYNTLTAISRLCDVDAARAKDAVAQFSAYLRRNIDALSTGTTVTFAQELEHVQIYLSLEKMRFEDEIDIVYDIRATGFCIPPLSVQPLVENAVRHGIGRRPCGGTVTLATRETTDAYLITIADDGVGFDTSAVPGGDERTHIGITNVRQRLEALSGGTLDIDSAPGRGTVATITIPREGRA